MRHVDDSPDVNKQQEQEEEGKAGVPADGDDDDEETTQWQVLMCSTAEDFFRELVFNLVTEEERGKDELPT